MSQKRKLEDPNEAFCQTPPKKSRTQYSLDFKLNVLDNAKSFSSNRTLASHFHIDERQIRQWNNSLEEFDLKVTENFRIAPSDNHNEGNELFLIDSDNETE